MGSVLERGSKWRVIWRKKGLLDKPISRNFDTEEAARKADAFVQAQLDNGVVPNVIADKPKASLSIAEGIDNYLAADQARSESVRTILQSVRNRFGSLGLNTIDRDQLLSMIEKMKAEKRAPSTIRNNISSLRRVWRHHAAPGTFDPFGALDTGYSTYKDHEVVNVEREYRVDDEVEQKIIDIVLRKTPGDAAKKHAGLLRSADPEQMALMIKVAITSAARLSEIFTLETAGVDGATIQLVKQKDKRTKPRKVMVSAEVAKMLAEYIERNDSRYLFPAYYQGETDKNERAKISSRIGNTFRKAAERAGHDELTFHDLRHEATSRLFERTQLNEILIAKLTGHKSMRTLMRYTNLRVDRLTDQMY